MKVWLSCIFQSLIYIRWYCWCRHSLNPRSSRCSHHITRSYTVSPRSIKDVPRCRPGLMSVYHGSSQCDHGSAKVEPRICQYCYTLPWISIIPRITPIVLNILKHQGSNPDRHSSLMSCHGLAKVSSVSLQFFMDAPGLTIRGDPASEPGQWDLGFSWYSAGL